MASERPAQEEPLLRPSRCWCFLSPFENKTVEDALARENFTFAHNGRPPTLLLLPPGLSLCAATVLFYALGEKEEGRGRLNKSQSYVLLEKDKRPRACVSKCERLSHEHLPLKGGKVCMGACTYVFTFWVSLAVSALTFPTSLCPFSPRERERRKGRPFGNF